MRKLKRIEHITQPTQDTCASTCIAMITGIPVDIVIQEFHAKYMNHHLSVQSYLRHKGYNASPTHVPLFPAALQRGKASVLIVPSLDSEGTFHSVIADGISSESGPMRILDPSKGRLGDRYYTGDPREAEANPEQAVMLVSWIVDTVVTGKSFLTNNKEVTP